ncbi:hypothetical protein C6Y14_22535 [Streptomyces dioscori]|uniref:Uncharacterized protein n=1 Tax=Streptomyces dioscori TaxID=2109333 RepID=A0A2P8Q4M9_9ACTN|nr:hypothetical protein C6Y14_22535 [Streptomyces dioscori]
MSRPRRAVRPPVHPVHVRADRACASRMNRACPRRRGIRCTIPALTPPSPSGGQMKLRAPCAGRDPVTSPAARPSTSAHGGPKPS